MPNYDIHLWLARKVGLLIGTLLALIAFIGGLLSPTSLSGLNIFILSFMIGAVGYYSTIVGGTAPDIDLSRPQESLNTSSIPYRKFVRALRLLVIIIVFLGYVQFIKQSTALLQVIGAIVAVSLAIATVRLVPDILHRFMPPHRTVTHDIGFWMVTGIAGVWIIKRILNEFQTDPFIQTYLSIAVGLPVFLGVVTHISADTVSNYVRDYAPSPVKKRAAQMAPWVPKHKPIIIDIPRLIRVFFDRRAPISIRLFVLLTVAYGLMPLDLISDFIPVIGWTDDLSIYLSLRSTVYSGYKNDEGVLENVQRRTATLFRVYIPVLMLSIVALLAIYFFVLQ